MPFSGSTSTSNKGGRAKADPSISPIDLMKPLQEYFAEKGTRDVYSLLSPYDHITMNSGLPSQALSDLASLFVHYTSLCTSGVVPRKAHLVALQNLNNQIVEGQGRMKINFQERWSDEKLYNWVDDKVRTMMLGCVCGLVSLYLYKYCVFWYRQQTKKCKDEVQNKWAFWSCLC